MKSRSSPAIYHLEKCVRPVLTRTVTRITTGICVGAMTCKSIRLEVSANERNSGIYSNSTLPSTSATFGGFV